MKRIFFTGLLTAGFAFGLTAQTKPLYENNFETAGLNAVPADMLVLNGNIAVKEEDGNKFLEVPGAPLEDYGVMFGPTQNTDAAVTARVRGTGKGRRFPTFGVGLFGQGGFKLQVSPGKKTLEIYQGEEAKASAPYAWESGFWTQLKLQVRRVKEGAWRVEGKAWKQGTPEPAAWSITLDVTEEPPAGRPTILGNPYSDLPIQFDDLVVTVPGK